jgi:hypothetical protein
MSLERLFDGRFQLHPLTLHEDEFSEYEIEDEYENDHQTQGKMEMKELITAFYGIFRFCKNCKRHICNLVLLLSQPSIV